MRIIDAEKLFFEGSSIAFKSLESFDEPLVRVGIEMGIRRMKDMIAIAPEIEAEPVEHGEWLDTRNISYSVRCSVCGSYSLDETFYCPHCGTKMDGGDENA